MESAQEQVKIVVTTSVIAIKQIDNNWFYHFDGSRESINLGPDKHFEEGDVVRITFEKE